MSEWLEVCRRSPQFDRVEPDLLLRALLAPNDPRFQDGSQWHLDNSSPGGGRSDGDIRARAGWNAIRSADDVIVAIVDTGIRASHEDLADSLWVNPGESGPDAEGKDKETNGIDDDGNGYVDDVHGIDAIANSGTPIDESGHGSHIAGLIGASGDNGVGGVGVAWRTRLMACKFMTRVGEGSLADAIQCIDYARANGARIINASWGASAFSGFLESAIRRARDAGIVFVTAAGNDARDIDASPLYPASFELDNIVAVTATTRRDRLASFSSFGARSVDLGAPGASLYSTSHESDFAYSVLSGSSVAAPLVAGACALVAQQNPRYDYRQIIGRVLEGVDPVSALAGTCVTGGRLNLAGALEFEFRADFSVSVRSGPAPLTVQFIDRSSGPIASRSWDFGDGTSVNSDPEPIHEFSDVGEFVVTLAVIDDTGRTARKSQVIQVTEELLEGLAVAPLAGGTIELEQGSSPNPISIEFTLTNVGEDGLEWRADSSASWVALLPAVGHLGGGETVLVRAGISELGENLPPGTYWAAIEFQNVTTGQGGGERTVELTVRPASDPFQITPEDFLRAAGPPGGPFRPALQEWALENRSRQVLSWSAASDQAWLTLSSNAGVLNPGETFALAAFVNAQAAELEPGVHAAEVTFALDLSSEPTIRRAFLLSVGELPRLLASRSVAGTDGVEVTLQGAPGVAYVLEESADLLLWTPVAAETANANGDLVFVLSSPPGSAPTRYFRARVDSSP